jgi:N-acetyl-anhydromuramyl-L-alanine amidase AmpD
MTILIRESPNHGARPFPGIVDTIVMHADAHPDVSPRGEDVVRAFLCTRHADPDQNRSYHEHIGRDGIVWQLVPWGRRAWACGRSTYEGREDVNDFSVSLCFANRDDGKEFLTAAQIDSAVARCVAIIRAHPNVRRPNGRLAITTHAIIAPGRKYDPRALSIRDFILRVERRLNTEAAA